MQALCVLDTEVLEYIIPYISRQLAKKKHYINLLTTMLATSKNVLFPGPTHLLPIGTDDFHSLALGWYLKCQVINTGS